MLIVRLAVRLRVVVAVVTIRGRSTIVRVVVMPVVVIVWVPDRVQDQRRDVHTRIYIDGGR